ncbi:hypothetical protein BAU15_07240 [Enterococcus sp. JM4C]|uniref:replication initiation protein n=1 Tax=Candidatus Enterococcus huntleyi TaxID=1857217 RepID=UPI00137969FD|nr:replication initiation protein [Enterococcus sp. JM4C]KAF1297502.1 hypothetical protein BAU15_07240 [Enterococcus sp. JM4C]
MNKLSFPHKQHNFHIAKSNKLLREGRNDLSKKAFIISEFLISNIKPEDTGFSTVEVSVNELNEILGFPNEGGKAIQNTKEAILELGSKAWWWVEYDEKKNTKGIKPKKKESLMRWLDKAELIDNNTYHLKLSEVLTPYLIQLKNQGNYTQYQLYDVVNLGTESKAALQLYGYLRSYAFQGEVEITVEILRELLDKHVDATGNEIRWATVNRDIKKAIEVINKKTLLKVDYIAKKSGRKTTALVFFLELKETKVINEEEPASIENNKGLIKAEFEKIWRNYPKKTNKVSGEKYFLQAIDEGIDIEVIKTGILNYSQYVEENEIDFKYVLSGGNFFKNKRWEDEWPINHVEVEETAIFSPDFEELWTIYPKKADKEKAFMAFDKLMIEHLDEYSLIRNGVFRYRRFVNQEKKNLGTVLDFKVFLEKREYLSKWKVKGQKENLPSWFYDDLPSRPHELTEEEWKNEQIQRLNQKLPTTTFDEACAQRVKEQKEWEEKILRKL